MAKRIYSVGELNPVGTSATWTRTVASNLETFNKTAGDDTSIVYFAIPSAPRGTFQTQPDAPIKNIEVGYTVATASLDAAPTAVVNKVTYNTTTKAYSRAAVANTLTFEGTNTTGTAAGTYAANIKIDSPAALAENELLTVEVTFNAAATTVLKVTGAEVETF